MGKVINKLKSLADIYGGKFSSDLVYMITVIFFWTGWLIPNYPGWSARILSIFLVVFITSKVFLIFYDGWILRKDNRGEI